MSKATPFLFGFAPAAGMSAADLEEKKPAQAAEPIPSEAALLSLLSYDNVLKLEEKESDEYKGKYEKIEMDILSRSEQAIVKTQREIKELSQEIQELEKRVEEQKSRPGESSSELSNKEEKQRRRLVQLKAFIDQLQKQKATAGQSAENLLANHTLRFPEAKDKMTYYLEYFHNDQFFYLKKEGATNADTGWKIHIAIDDKKPGNIRRAWNAILPLLITCQVETAKMTMPKVKFTGSANRGKQITLYHSEGVTWQALLYQIEQALTDAKIAPDEGPLADQQLSGSKYLFYRNEIVDYSKLAYYQRETLEAMQRDSDGSWPQGYIPAHLAHRWFPGEAYNPQKAPCPFADIRVSVKKTPGEPPEIRQDPQETKQNAPGYSSGIREAQSEHKQLSPEAQQQAPEGQPSAAQVQFLGPRPVPVPPKDRHEVQESERCCPCWPF